MTYWLISEDAVMKSERNIARNRLLSSSGLGDEYGGTFLSSCPNSIGSQNGGILYHTQRLHRLSNHSNASTRSSRNKSPRVNPSDTEDLDRSSLMSDAVVYDLFRSSENASIRRGSSRKSFAMGIDALFRVGVSPHNDNSRKGYKEDRRQKWWLKNEYNNQFIPKTERSTSKIGSSSDRYLKVPLSTKASSFKCSPTSSGHSANSLQRNSLTDEITYRRTRTKTMSSKLAFKDPGNISENGSPLL